MSNTIYRVRLTPEGARQAGRIGKIEAADEARANTLAGEVASRHGISRTEVKVLAIPKGGR